MMFCARKVGDTSLLQERLGEMTANCLALVELNSELGSCLPYLQLFGVDDCY